MIPRLSPSSRNRISQISKLTNATSSHTNFIPVPRFYPAGCRFRPSDDMMANYFLNNKVLGQPKKEVIIPEERTNGPEPRILWTRVGEDTTVFDPQGSVVGIKCTYALTEQEEVSDDISLPDEIEPPREELFIEEISLPPSVVDTDLVLCHVILNKIEKLEPYVMTSEDEDEDDGRLTYHRRGRLLICLP
ncbi:hypothetical protein Bca4012_072772 [Brassica carinata]